MKKILIVLALLIPSCGAPPAIPEPIPVQNLPAYVTKTYLVAGNTPGTTCLERRVFSVVTYVAYQNSQSGEYEVTTSFGQTYLLEGYSTGAEAGINLRGAFEPEGSFFWQMFEDPYAGREIVTSVFAYDGVNEEGQACLKLYEDVDFPLFFPTPEPDVMIGYW